MSNNPEQLLFSIIGVVVLVFIPIIIFSLRYRKNLQKQWAIETCAETVIPLFPRDGSDNKTLLYGTYQDFSATTIGMIVKNENDEEVGRVLFNTGNIAFEIGNDKFSVSSENSWNYYSKLRHLSGAPSFSPVIAECRRTSFSFTADYFFPKIGNFRVQEHPSGHAKITKDGVIVGHRISLSRSYDKGRAISLSMDIPLILQMLLLASPHLHRSRGGTPY
ncbi:hypothetical protein [Nitrosomonas sp. PY1]|uniref:hypothetical protein n=1 Tax=Nitrosomonas sp. PY1 TaxID=1803906 RepID=UPI001FC8C0E0|nr:hypothetical protein [Nitrosomonas sp. PY1]